MKTNFGFTHRFIGWSDGSLAEALLIDERVAGHLKQPRAWIFQATEGPALPQRLDKNLLQEVIRQVFVR